jgi:three-Cys-motif partner protein
MDWYPKKNKASLDMIFDEIGYWSKIKLDIVREYASAYSKILSAQTNPSFYHIYIDAFAGAGMHKLKITGDFVPGSPLNALNVTPPFREYHLIDLKSDKVKSLNKIIGDRPGVYIYNGDCNDILLKEVFPKVLFKDYRRALCLLDPYGLHLNWEVIKTAAEMRTIDIVLNFPVADMNRNVLWRNAEGVDPADIDRMNSFWGDESWREVAYSTTGNLFGFPEKENNEKIAEGFRQRLRLVAGFKQVPKPLPMKNSKNAVVYYLFFASQKLVAKDIIKQIFLKYT